MDLQKLGDAWLEASSVAGRSLHDFLPCIRDADSPSKSVITQYNAHRVRIFSQALFAA